MHFGLFWFHYGSPALALIVCILNGIEIFALFRRCRMKNLNRSRHKASLLLLLNLSISDFSVGLTVIMIKVLWNLIDHKVISYTKVTKIVYDILLILFLRLSLLTSIFNLLAMTFDRVFSIRNPLQYHYRIRRKHITSVIIIIWALSASLIVGYYYLAMHQLSDRGSRRYRGTIFPATILPAITSFCYCYIVIFKAIRIQGRSLRVNSRREDFEDSRTNSYRLHVIRRELKVARLSGFVVLMFIICWFPLAVLGIVNALGYIMSNKISNPIYILAFLNSALNPLIYFGYKKELCRQSKLFIRNLCKSECFTLWYSRRKTHESTFTIFSSSEGVSFEHPKNICGRRRGAESGAASAITETYDTRL